MATTMGMGMMNKNTVKEGTTNGDAFTLPPGMVMILGACLVPLLPRNTQGWFALLLALLSAGISCFVLRMAIL